jgi:hypothetical protein
MGAWEDIVSNKYKKEQDVLSLLKMYKSNIYV